MADSSNSCNIPNFDTLSTKELTDLYSSYTTNTDKNRFIHCVSSKYKVPQNSDSNVFNDSNDSNDISNIFNKYNSQLEDTENAKSINENTISLYNNDLLYIILKFSLFLLLGYVYYVYVKNMNVVTTMQNIKNKTIEVSQKIKDTASSVSNKIKLPTSLNKPTSDIMTNPTNLTKPSTTNPFNSTNPSK